MMSFIYPLYLFPDLTGFSDEALRVWKGIWQVDYVETIEDNSISLEGALQDGDNWRKLKSRFRWKD